jgi:hypothetical protein
MGQLELSVDELMQKYESDVEADCKPRIRAKYSIDQARTDYPEDVLVRWAWSDELYRLRPHLGGPFPHLQRLSDEDLARRLARDELVLAEPIRKRVDAIWAREARGVTIGMHVRHTDRKNRYDHYPILVDEVRRQNPRATLFLATDSTAVEAAFRGRYDRVVVTDKWHPPAGMPLHRTRGCPDKVQIGIEALVDLWLLSRCEYLIYNSTSSFGLFAALLSSSSPENLIDTAPRTQVGVRRLKQWVKEFLV